MVCWLLKRQVVFNLLPGQGLGFTGSKLIAFGLAPVRSVIIDVPVVPKGNKPTSSSGGDISRASHPTHKVTVLDNQYVNIKNDDNEIIELLSIIIGVME